MSTIDERVVSMQFDNSKFEKNANDTLSTLDKLKQSLKFDDEAKSFADIEAASGKVGFGGLTSALQTVSQQFSALEIVALAVFSNLATKAIETGLQFAKSLSVDQIAEGWSKYEQKTQSVQMLVNQGYAIEEVNSQLETLNWFTDETSYSFSDMVNNIGKFTAQGRDLEESITAMEGISTWAALSGAGINGASRAMYNLSQALGVGAVKLIDWKSIENANMATLEFKNEAIDAAVAIGTLTKETQKDGSIIYKTLEGIEVNAVNFSSTLEHKWFNSDVMMKVLDTYGGFSSRLNEAVEETGMTATELLRVIDKYKKGALSDKQLESYGLAAKYIKELGSETYNLGFKAFKAAQEATTFSQAVAATKDAVSTSWMTTFELIFGNYEKAKDLWTGLANGFYDIFAQSGEMRNDVLSEAFNSSWDNLSRQISDAGYDAQAFEEMLLGAAQKAGVNTEDLLSEYGSFYNALQADWKNANGDVIDKNALMKTSMDAIIKELESMSEKELEAAGHTKDDIKGLKELRAAMDDTNSSTSQYISTLENRSARDNLVDSINNIISGIRELMDVLDKAFNAVFFPDSLKAKDELEAYDQRVTTIADAIKRFSEWVKNLTEKFTFFTTAVDKNGNEITILNAVGAKIFETFKNLGTIFTTVKSLFDSFVNGIKSGSGGAIKNAGGNILDLVMDFSKLIATLMNFIEKSVDIQNAFYYIGYTISQVVGHVMNIVNLFKNFVHIITYASGDTKTILQALINFAKNTANELIDLVTGFITNVTGGVINLKAVGELIKTVLGTIFGVIAKFINPFEYIVEISKTIINRMFDVKHVFELLSNTIEIVALKIQNGLIIKFMTGLMDIRLKILSFTKDFEHAMDKIGYLTEHSVINYYLHFWGDKLEIFKLKVKSVIASITGYLSGTFNTIKTVFGNLGMFLKTAFTNGSTMMADFFADFTGVVASAGTTGGVLAIIFNLVDVAKNFALFFKDFRKIAKSIADGLETVEKCFKSYQKNLRANRLRTIGLAILEIAAAMFLLSRLDSDELATALIGMTAALVELVLASALMKLVEVNNQTVKNLTIFCSALLILSLALVIVGKVPLLMMLPAVIALSQVASILISVAKKLDGIKVDESSVSSIATFCIAVNLLARALKTIGKMPLTNLVKGVPVLLIITNNLAIVAKKLDGISIDPNTASVLATFSLCINLVAIALRIIGRMSIGKLAKGVAGMVAISIDLIIVSHYLGNIKITKEDAAYLASFAHAIKTLSRALRIIGSMPLPNLLKAVPIMLVLISYMITMAKKLNDITISPQTSLGILAFVAAITALSLVLQFLGHLKIKTYLKAAIGMAAVFAIIAGFGMITATLLPLIPAMEALAVAMLLFGAAIGVAAFGLAALIGAITLLGAALPILAGELIAFLQVFFTGLIGLIPTIINALRIALVDLVVAILRIIIDIVPYLKDALISLIGLIFDLLKEIVPKIFTFLKQLITEFIAFLYEYVPKFLALAVFIVKNILITIKDNIEEFVTLGIQIIAGFIRGLSNGLPELIDAAFKLVISFLNGLADAIDKNSDDLISAVKKLVKSIINAAVNLLKNAATSFLNIGKKLFGEDFGEGIKKSFGTVKDKAKEIIEKIKEAVSEKIEDIKNLGKDVVDGFLKGINEFKDKIKNKFKELIGSGEDAAKDEAEIHSPSRLFARIGGYLGEGLIVGLDGTTKDVNKSSANLAATASDAMVSGMNYALKSVYDVLDQTDVSDFTITPVMDLSEIQNGTKTMSNMLDMGDYSINAAMKTSGNVNAALNAKMQNSNLAALADSIKKMANADSSSNVNNNTFNITGDNPKEIANEVSKILQQQVERRQRQWA